MSDDSVVLVKNAKGRFVFCDPEAADALIARSGKDENDKPLASIVEAGSPEYDRGSEFAAGGKGSGVRGSQVLKNTSEGLVAGEE